MDECRIYGLNPFSWSLRFHTFHLDRSSALDMIWQEHGILRVAIMIHDLVHVRVTESSVMLLWDQLREVSSHAEVK